MIYVDTSALLSIIDTKDINHKTATKYWREQVQSASFIINSYSMLETIVLVQSRLGLDAVRILAKEILPIIEVDWLGSDQHEIAMNHVLAANRRKLSLVDCASFETMRHLRIEKVFTFDDHFKGQGFTVVP